MGQQREATSLPELLPASGPSLRAPLTVPSQPVLKREKCKLN